MPRCERITGATGAGGYHQEIWCDNEPIFHDGAGETICASCAVEELGEGGMVTPFKAAHWTDLIDEFQRRAREHNKNLVEALAKARADLKPAQDEVQRLREEVRRLYGADIERDKLKKEIAEARAEIDRLRVLRRAVDDVPAPADAPRVPTTMLLEVT